MCNNFFILRANVEVAILPHLLIGSLINAHLRFWADEEEKV